MVFVSGRFCIQVFFKAGLGALLIGKADTVPSSWPTNVIRTHPSNNRKSMVLDTQLVLHTTGSKLNSCRGNGITIKLGRRGSTCPPNDTKITGHVHGQKYLDLLSTDTPRVKRKSSSWSFLYNHSLSK